MTEVEPIPVSSLDDGVLRLGDGRPAIALTLRCDRPDNFFSDVWRAVRSRLVVPPSPWSLIRSL